LCAWPPSNTLKSLALTATYSRISAHTLDFTRFRVTFKQPGTYKYICVLHDNIGMVGTVVLEP
jgi:plastocyanin